MAATLFASSVQGDASYDWCDCGYGLNWVKFWPAEYPDRVITIPNDGRWHDIYWSLSVSTIGWICDGMDDKRRARLASSATWSVLLHIESKSCWPAEWNTGRLSWQNHPWSNNAVGGSS